jgi:ZIP family zinc transporter
VSTIAAIVGYVVFSHLSAEINAATIAIAAGAILAMLADTMMPEAYEEGHNLVGLITVVGFLAAFVLTKIGA